MANEELTYFNVKNKSIRLVHIGGVSIPPEKVVAVLDDEKGINRIDVEGSEYLEETDEEVSDMPTVEAEKPKATKKAAKTETATKTATGAGWNSK